MSLTAYVPTTWVDYADSPDLEASFLNHFEVGIQAVTAEVIALEAALPSTYQPLSGELSAIAAQSSTGFLKRTGAGAWSIDANTYALASAISLDSTRIAVGNGSGIAGTDYLTYTTSTGSGAITVSGPSRANSTVFASLEGVGSSFRSPTLTLSNPDAVWGIQNYYGALQAILAGDSVNPLMTLSTIGSFTVGNNGITNAFIGVNGLTSNTRGFFIAGAGINRFMITLGNDGLSTFRSYNSSGALIDNPITWANNAVTDLITVNRSISLATTSAFISFASGSSAPTFTTRSGGTKMILYPALTGATTDYAIGVETNNIWYSVPGAGQGFKWYQGITSIMALTSTGLTAPAFIKSGGTSYQFLKADGSVDSSTYISGSGTSGQVAHFNGVSTLTSNAGHTWDGVILGIGLNNAVNNAKLNIQNNAGNAGGPEINLLGAAGPGATDSNSAKIVFGSGSGSSRFICTTDPMFKFQRWDPSGSAWNTVYQYSSGTLTDLGVKFFGALTASSFVKSGGTSSQLLAADGTTVATSTFQAAHTVGNLTESTSSVLTITGGTGAVIGSGLSIQVKRATASVSGYLSSTDWSTFNGKQDVITNPITGTGNGYSGTIPLYTGLRAIGYNDALRFSSSDASTSIGIGLDNQRISIGAQNTGFGCGAFYSNTSGAFNSALGYSSLNQNTTGNYNNGLGASSLASNIVGSSNNAMGFGALFYATGSYNTAVGDQAGYEGGAISNCVYLGNYSGRHNAASSKLFIDAFDRYNSAGDLAGAIITGTMDANPANQTLTLNAATTVSNTLTATQLRISALNTAPASSSATGTLGEIRLTNGFVYVCVATNTWRRAGLDTW